MKVLALATLLVVAPLASAGDAPTLKPGDPAPVLKDVNWLQGKPVASWEPGNVYVLDFWATWCGPCKRSIPDLDKFADKHTNDNVHVIGVAISPHEGMVPTADFVKEKGEAMSYGICEDIDRKTATAFMEAAAQNGIPTCMVIDKAGKLAWLGNPLGGQLESTVDAVVAGTWDTAAFAQKIAAEQANEAKANELQKALAEAAKAKDFTKVADLAGQLFALDPENYGQAALIKYDALVRGQKADDAAKYGQDLVKATFKDNANALNSLAWSIVDPKNPRESTDLPLARLAADRANELTSANDFSVLDTLARVCFLQGDVDKAIMLQQKAVDSAPDEAKDELKTRLTEYQAAKKA
ncbi:MAG TPA: redoxin family protein [Planctomycetota bacterium]|nr:redoxin family protein [Planctomycetota bacterium]